MNHEPALAPASKHHAAPSTQTEAAKVLVDSLWEAGLREKMKRESLNPSTEDVDLNLGSGRDSVDCKYASRAATAPWFQISDEIQDSNYDYIQAQRDAAVDDIFKESIGSRGAHFNSWSDALSRFEDLFEDFDEDLFEEDALAAFRDLAHEDNVDILFDVEPQLGGSCGAFYTILFDLKRCGPEDLTPMVPDFLSPNSALDWASMFSMFNIHPADYANANRSMVLAQLDEPGPIESIGIDLNLDEDDSADIKKETLEEFARQGMSQDLGHDPSSWTGGMLDVAKAFASQGWSLPAPRSPTSLSVGGLVDALSLSADSLEFQFAFDVDGSSLQTHSELIDRFTDDSPLCGEILAEQTLVITSGAHLYVNDTDLDIAFSGPMPVEAASISFTNDSQSVKDCAEACMRARREAACSAEKLRWSLRNLFECPHDTSLMAQTLNLCSTLGCAEPQAALHALSRAASHPDADAHIIEKARAETERFAEMARQRDAKISRLPKDTTDIGIEDFDIRFGGLMSAPWRVDVSSAIAFNTDSLGNTLAHKACAARDPALLRFALASNPALSTQRNLADISPLDMILTAQKPSDIVHLALALLSANPELSNAKGDNGRTILDVAAGRSCSCEQLTALAGAGCSLSALSHNSLAPWRHWINADGKMLTARLAPFIAHGWSIDSQDGLGQGLAHKAKRLCAVMALVDLGADLAVPNREGLPGGSELRGEDFAHAERHALARAHPTTAPRASARSL